MDRTRWIIFSVICAAIITALVVMSGSSKINVDGVDANTIATEGTGTDHVFGNAQAKTVLFEYGDFQCPGCGSLYPYLKTLKEKYKDNLALVFRNFPLTSTHPNALAAATAAGAASKQNKFWEMHNILFDNQTSWSNATVETRAQIFEDYASQIGLNLDQYRQDLTATDVADKIAYDRAIGKKLGVNSTPTLYLNGKKLEPAQWNSEAALEATLRAQLKADGVVLSDETTTP